MNRLVVIGMIGTKKAYLNISRDAAIERWLDSETNHWEDESYRNWQRAELWRELKDGTLYSVTEFEFEDEFSAYDVWA